MKRRSNITLTDAVGWWIFALCVLVAAVFVFYVLFSLQYAVFLILMAGIGALMKTGKRR